MIKETIQKIEESIRHSGSIEPRKKEELAKLLASLKSEIEKLSKTHGEQAESIAGFAGVASHEATRRERASHLRSLSLEGLASSVKGFETSHPQLVETVNAICRLLSNIGI